MGTSSYDVTAERKVTLMCEPHLMAFTHILNHEPSTPQMEAQKIIACTDGDTVWYGSEYTALPAPERAYIHVHELMHGIFRHADRVQLIRLSKGTVNPAIFNVAADAVINEGIESNPAMPGGMFKRPDKFPPVLMATIHETVAEAIKFSGEKPPSDYDPKARHGMQAEVLYNWLMWALDAVKRKRQKDCPRAQDEQAKKEAGKDKSDKGQPKPDKGDAQQPGDGDQDGDDGASKPGEGAKCDPKGKPSDKPCTCGQCPGQKGQGGPGGQGGDGGDLTKIEQMAGGDAWDLVEQLEKLQELLDKGVTPSELIDKINGKIDEARMRIEQVVQGLKLAGRGQGSLLLELAGDMPQSVVPWEQLLRRVATRGLGTKLNDSYVRYGSPTMTALARGSRQVPFSPGTTIFTERPQILVVLDVSGSHIGMLPQCFSEIWRIASVKGAVVKVMTFDDGVREIIEITNRNDFNKVLEKGIKGGGGTWLGDVWAEIAKMRDPYRMVVVMTDGYLDAGEKPKIPVIWMVTPGGATEFATYGEVIYLPEYMKQAA